MNTSSAARPHENEGGCRVLTLGHSTRPIEAFVALLRAHYMQTADFAAHLAGLIELARAETVALMCAEAVPWRCHRSLIADALVVHGVATCEIVGPMRLQSHQLTPFACVRGLEITYPSTPSGTPTGDQR